MTEQEKQKQIEEMDKIIYQNACEVIRVCGTCNYGEKKSGFTDCVSPKIAEALYNAGYGDTKQAVREFAEKVKELVSDITTIDWSNNRLLYDGIDQLVKETCGE